MLNKKILILGSGAIGSVIGGMLTKAGHNVILADQWSNHVDVMKNNGIKIKKYDGKDFSVDVNAIHIHELQAQEKFDLIILSVKSYDTAWATQMGLEYLSDEGIFVVAQNGINDPRVAEIASSERVIGCVVVIGAALEKPGIVKWTGSPGNNVGFKVGELDGSSSVRITQVAELLSDVCPTQVTNNLWGERWAKLATNSMSNALAGLTGLKSVELRQNSEIRTLSIEIASELVNVGSALGVDIEKIGMVPANLFPQALENDEIKKKVEGLIIDAGKTIGTGRPSLAQDLLKGRSTEVDYLNGYIVNKGKQVNIPTPVNESIVELTREIEKGLIQPSLSNLNLIKKSIVN